MASTRNRKAHFFWSVVVVFIIQLPLLLYSAQSITSFVAQVAVFLAIALAVGALYVGLVTKLNADKQEPVPWYASPVVWLGLPTLVVILYMFFT
jgi:hypothetical protein